ncbi:MAG TPA: hypothetical protein VIW25_06530 [Nitrososphaeraceae archaeon]
MSTYRIFVTLLPYFVAFVMLPPVMLPPPVLFVIALPAVMLPPVAFCAEASCTKLIAKKDATSTAAMTSADSAVLRLLNIKGRGGIWHL